MVDVSESSKSIKQAKDPVANQEVIDNSQQDTRLQPKLELSPIIREDLSQIDYVRNLRVFGGADVALELSDICGGDGDDCIVGSIDKKTILSLALGPFGPLNCAVEDFLNKKPEIKIIKDLSRMITSQSTRLRMLPNDVEISANFKMRRIDSRKNNSLAERWAMILSVNHFFAPTINGRDYFGNRFFEGHNYLIFENVLNKITKAPNSQYKHEFVTADCAKNISFSVRPIAQTPQQNKTLGDYGLSGYKKEFDSLGVSPNFDYRSFMFLLGKLISQYLSTNEININCSAPAVLKVNVSTNCKILDNEIFYTKACGSTDAELNTFCVLAGLIKINTVILLTDRYCLCEKVLTDFGLYEYVCTLIRNILYTSNSLGCGVEHLWALMAGMHSVIKIHAHSDEGGIMRSFLTNPLYPHSSGILLEASRDVLNVATELRVYSYFSKAQLLDLLLFFPNALNFSDSGVVGLDHFMPSVFHCGHNPKRNPSLYMGFAPAVYNVIENMRTIMAKVFNLESAITDQSDVYASAFNKLNNDRHLNNQIIIPFLWIDPAISNIYNLATIFHEEKIGYYEDAVIPFMPKNTSVDYLPGATRQFMLAHDTADITMHSHSIRDYGYGYIMNPRYNESDGLSMMVVMNEGHLASKHYMENNFLFSKGECILGQNKWTMPHCTINNYYESYMAKDNVSVRLVSTSNNYFPNPNLFTGMTLDQVHGLTRMHVSNEGPKQQKHGCYINSTMKRVFSRAMAQSMLHRHTDTTGCRDLTVSRQNSGWTKDYKNIPQIKRIGDHTMKINLPEKQESGVSLATALTQHVAKQEKNIDTPYIANEATQHAATSGLLDSNTSEVSAKIDKGDVLSLTEGPRIAAPLVQLGGENVAEQLSQLIIPSEEVHDIDVASLPLAPYEWDSHRDGMTEVSKLIKNPAVSSQIINQVKSYNYNPGSAFLIDRKHTDANFSKFTHDVVDRLMEENIVPLDYYYELGGIGDSSAPSAKFIRIPALHTGRRHGKIVTQFIIAHVTQTVGSQPVIKKQYINKLDTKQTTLTVAPVATEQ